MKAVSLSLIFGVACIAATAPVEIKTVPMPTVNFGTVPQPTRTETVLPITGQNLPAGKIVETKSVDTTTLHFGTVTTKIVPQTNFAAKRAVVAGQLPAADTVKSSKANIEKRVIRPGTAAGVEELKEQFKTPH